MKQIYYTWCEAGKGLQADGSGFQIRAASAGVEFSRLRAAAACAAYELPAGTSPDNAATAPVRLAMLSNSETGRMLCHCNWIGQDAASGRDDNYFAHILVDLPSSLDAQHAIQSWGSPNWQREDDGGGTELPEMLSLPVADKLNDAELTKFLDHPGHRDWLKFLLTALLTAQPRRRVFLAAPADAVAMCVFGVTHALPATLLEDFTFSTYEREPLARSARIVGTCWAAGAEMDLPDACYSDGQAAFNTYSGRQTELSAVAFAEFAVEALATGKLAALEEFRNLWQRLGVKDIALMDLLFRMSRGTARLTKEESQQVLQNAAVTAWVATRNEAMQQFLEWALDDPNYASTSFSRAVVALRQKPDALAKLAQTVQELGLASVKAGDRSRTANALETILPMVAPARANAVWDEVLAKVIDPDMLNWEIRWYLLPKFARLRPVSDGQPIDRIMAMWLRVPAVQLAALLALDLPRSHQLAACQECLARDGESSNIFAQALAAHPSLVLPLVQQVAAQPKGEERAGQLFEVVFAEIPEHPWAEDLVRDGQSFPASLLDRCLDSVLNAGKVDAEHLVRNTGASLLKLLPGKSSLDRIAAKLLSQPPDDLVTDGDLVSFLRKLSDDDGLTQEVRHRLDAALTLEEFLRQPSLAVDALRKVTTALAIEPPLAPHSVRLLIIEKVARQLGNKAGDADVQTDLENVLLTLGPQSEGGPATLYRELLRLQPDATLFGRQNNLLHAFLAVALGAIQSAELAQQIDNLEGDAYSLAAQLARRGRKKALAQLDEKTADWPKTARTQWSFLVKAVQPRGWQGVGRDAIFFAAGLIAGGIIVLILRAIGVWSL